MAIPPNEQYNTFEDFLMRLLSFCVGQQFFNVLCLTKKSLKNTFQQIIGSLFFSTCIIYLSPGIMDCRNC